jgi:hypothetical protein
MIATDLATNASIQQLEGLEVHIQSKPNSVNEGCAVVEGNAFLSKP